MTCLVITSDHDDTDTGLVTGLDGWLDFGTWGIEHTGNTDKSDILTDWLVMLRSYGFT